MQQVEVRAGEVEDVMDGLLLIISGLSDREAQRGGGRCRDLALANTFVKAFILSFGAISDTAGTHRPLTQRWTLSRRRCEHLGTSYPRRGPELFEHPTVRCCSSGIRIESEQPSPTLHILRERLFPLRMEATCFPRALGLGGRLFAPDGQDDVMLPLGRPEHSNHG